MPSQHSALKQTARWLPAVKIEPTPEPVTGTFRRARKASSSPLEAALERYCEDEGRRRMRRTLPY